MIAIAAFNFDFYLSQVVFKIGIFCCFFLKFIDFFNICSIFSKNITYLNDLNEGTFL